MMGCEELIVSTPEDLVEEAISISLNKDRLSTLRGRVTSSISNVYRDLESVRGLERAIREWTTTKSES
jgi:hypothetical protein